jgi:phosphatidate cytidylyltransferase
MTAAFTAVVLLDGFLDGTVTSSLADDKQVRGTLLCILMAALIVFAVLEFAGLTAAKGLVVLKLPAIVASILFATTWYWPQVLNIRTDLYLTGVGVFAIVTLLVYHYLRCGIDNIIPNCGVTFLAIAYFGILTAFVPAVRIELGLWPLLMFVFVVKAADIGAYTAGSLWGKHKFSPKISPGKTWEGMAGAVVAAAVIAVLFAMIFGIMTVPLAVVFGVCFAFIGQLGDLAESLMKRDAQQKDSGRRVPGFGGILDVIDSPLMAAPFAYLFFALTCR